MPSIRPASICVEATTRCQLACPGCMTAARTIASVSGSGYLRASSFLGILENAPWVRHVELSNNGEMFLNPELAEIIRIAAERDVRLTAANGVNLNHATDEVLEAMVRHGFYGMAVSLDGVSQEVYSQYRRRGDIGRVFANIEKINSLKKKYDTPYPYMVWQFVVFAHNEHEMVAAAFQARRYGMAIRYKLQWNDDYSPLKNPDMARKIMGAATRAEFEAKHDIHYMAPACLQLWKRPIFNWDGAVIGCCKNWWAHFEGNALKDGVEVAVNGEGIAAARRALQGKAELPEDSPCARCEVYAWRSRCARWITDAELAEESAEEKYGFG